MIKEELVHLTLKQLSESLKGSPENLRLEDTEIGPMNGNFLGPTLIWQFKVETKPGTYIQDPLNASRTVLVTYNKISNQLSCMIYFREVNSINHAIMADAHATIQLYHIPWFNRTYRQFMDIRSKLIEKKREQEYVEYLKKLSNIFPSTHIEDILK
jgi:hypothetical protein